MGNEGDRDLAVDRESESLRHVVGFCTLTMRKRPVEAVQKVRQEQGDRQVAEIESGTHAAAGAERDELVGIEPGRGVHFFQVMVDKPFGIERVGVCVHARVAVDGREVEDELGAGGEVVAQDFGGLGGLAGKSQWECRVHSVYLLDNGLQVGEVRKVGFCHKAIGTHHKLKFVLGTLHGSRMRDELRHGPLHRRGTRLAPSIQYVLHDHPS